MRKLASIQKITKIVPIKGAEAIETAHILGWECVVKKSEFKEGDLVVYCEVDSMMPEKPEFEFLRDRKFRIKTIRLRGQISQGICFAIKDILPALKYEEDQDVTDLIGVKKYEPYKEPFKPSTAKRKNKYIFPKWMPFVVRWFMRKLFEKYCYNHYLIGNTFPHFIPKTDETRVQILQKMLKIYKGVHCYVTEKVDGSSITFYLYKDKFGVCSRNVDLITEKDNHFWKYALDNHIELKMRQFFATKNIALQGELLGPGIQGNKYQLTEYKCLFFNVFDIDKQRYFDFSEFQEAIYQIHLQTVPIIDTLYYLTNDIPSIVSKSTIKSTVNPNIWAEGIVIRPKIEIVDRNSIPGLLRNRMSFKCINPEFLLKFGE